MAQVVEEKIPTDVLDYPVRWKKWLDGDTIDSYEVFVEAIGGDPSPLNKDSTSLNADEDTVTIWLSAGTIGNEYLIECKINTVLGRTKSEFFTVRVKTTD